MENEDFTIFLEDFADFLNGLEAAVAKMKQQIAKLVGVAYEGKMRRVRSPKPVSPNDPAVKWLMKKLEEIKAKHPEVTCDFVKDSSGMILELQYKAPDEEAAADIESPTVWAFQKASERT